CYQCYLLCPDGAIAKTDNKKIEFDYDFCKGCGVCAHECPFNAIEMIKEEVSR
ncbi:MAG: 4Fe-4S binding protein, partial [Spirochaetales bacterium]|nr:4Fe-4S binding protein [Spirochaetales bacterium]